jgi:PPOX class probable F420-dependent enzyme
VPPLTTGDARQFVADHHWGVLVTLKASDGRPQLSNVAYALIDDEIRVSLTDSRAKTANLRNDPRVSLHVTSDDFWTYVVVEGTARLSPVARDPGDETCERLLELYEAVSDRPHDDPDEFHAAMVDEGRLELSFDVGYLYPTRD